MQQFRFLVRGELAEDVEEGEGGESAGKCSWFPCHAGFRQQPDRRIRKVRKLANNPGK